MLCTFHYGLIFLSLLHLQESHVEIGCMYDHMMYDIHFNKIDYYKMLRTNLQI